MLVSVPPSLSSQDSPWQTYRGELFSVMYPGDWFAIGGAETRKIFGEEFDQEEDFDGFLLTDEEIDIDNFEPDPSSQIGTVTLFMASAEEDEEREFSDEIFDSIRAGLDGAYQGDLDIDGYQFHFITGNMRGMTVAMYLAVGLLGDYGFMAIGLFPQQNEHDAAAFMEDILDTCSFF